MKFRDRLFLLQQQRARTAFAFLVFLCCMMVFLDPPTSIQCGAEVVVQLVFGGDVAFWISLHPAWEDLVVSKGIKEKRGYASVDEVHAVCNHLLFSTCGDGHLFVEVGSAVGAVSLYAAALGMRVVAFDPLETNVHRIEQSLCLNGCSASPSYPSCIRFDSESFTIRHALVGSMSGVVAAVQSEPGNLAATMRGGGAVSSLNVSVVTLDEELFWSGNSIELLLLTCQGAELDALLGADALLGERRIHNIIWRVHHSTPFNTSQHILNLLWNSGFRSFYYLEETRSHGTAPRLFQSNAAVADYVLRKREPGEHPNVLAAL